MQIVIYTYNHENHLSLNFTTTSIIITAIFTASITTTVGVFTDTRTTVSTN